MTDVWIDGMQTARRLRTTRRAAEKMLAEAGILPVRMFRAADVERYAAGITPSHVERAEDPGEVVPPDAHLPDVMIHEPTGWEVDPHRGVVYTVRWGHQPRQVGTLTAKGLRRARQTVRHGSEKAERQWMISRVVWSAVNGRDVPSGWDVTHRNGNKADDRYANLEIRPIGSVRDEHGKPWTPA